MPGANLRNNIGCILVLTMCTSIPPVLLGTSERSIDERAGTISHQRAEAKEVIVYKNNLRKARKHQLRQAEQKVTCLQITLKADKGDDVAVPVPPVDNG